MKSKTMNIYKVLPAFLLPAFLLVSCTQDEVEPQAKEYPVELLMGMNQHEEVNLATRALPTGYTKFEPATDPGKIGIFMTQKQSKAYTYSDISGTFTWQNSTTWKSSVSVTYDPSDATLSPDYYVYGYMPAGGTIDATMTSSDGNFETGGVMSLTNVPPVSNEDVCIITGVKAGVSDGGTGYVDIAAADVKVGKYNFTASTKNSIYLLLDHIYSKFSLQMKVADKYNQLRTIKVTEMKMSASASSITVNVTYQNGEAPTVSLVKGSSSTPMESTLLSSEKALSTTNTDLTTFYCASVLDYITITTKFDVYDKAATPNKLRSGCTSTNTIKVQNLEKGKHYTIQSIVNPTYLYQLGQEDLNQPTVTF